MEYSELRNNILQLQSWEAENKGPSALIKSIFYTLCCLQRIFHCHRCRCLHCCCRCCCCCVKSSLLPTVLRPNKFCCCLWRQVIPFTASGSLQDAAAALPLCHFVDVSEVVCTLRELNTLFQRWSRRQLMFSQWNSKWNNEWQCKNIRYRVIINDVR